MRNYQQKIKSNIFIMAVFAIMLLGGGQLFGQTIRIASMAPQDSPWGRTLNRIAAEWHEISGGRITLQIYHGGVAGNEADVLRKIKINQLQGGVLTSSGMNSVTNKMLALSIPMQMRSKEEFLYVFDHVRPQLEASLREERLHVAGWTFGGWVYFFSRDPIESPESLRGSKLSVTPTEPDMQRAFQLMGYSPVPISTNEILTALNSGMVDSFFTSPLAAASFQFFAIANNMLNIPVAPFLGSVVISTRVWDR
ncbi:MAG: C4-dicarboxylate ABC transporter, partial [Spirochaetaceae bacterium]